MPAGSSAGAEELAELAVITGGLAHEIRNPLSTLKVNLQLLDEDWLAVESPGSAPGPDPVEVARRSRIRLRTLLSESARLERILEDFLKYVGRRELHLAPHDLNRIIAELADFFRPEAETHGINFVVLSSAVPVFCRVDANALKQALLNLLINAQQAMPDGGRLSVVVRPPDIGDPPMARIDVHDTGPGIPPDLREKVFEAYFSTKKGGTGLGLAAARRLVRAQGGDLRLTAPTGGGSCFSIVLPVTADGREAR